MNMDLDMLKKLAENPEGAALLEQMMAGMDFLSVLPPNIRRRANALKELDEEYLQKVSEAETKSMELNEKYSEKLAPLMKKVDSIISGEYEPEAPPASDEDEEDEEEEKEGDDVKGIPEYWLTVLQNTVSDLISEPDFDLLEKLIAMRTSYKNKGSTVRLEFEFSENDFITEKTLWIELDVSADDSAESAFLDYRSGGIEFKSTDKNLCYEVTEKKQRNKKNPEKVRVVESKKRSSSFFHIFSLDIEEETKETVMELIHFLATEAVPRSIYAFTGDLKSPLDDDFDDDEEEEEDEDDDDDENDGEDDEEPKAGSEEKPECKQQ